MMNLLNFVDGGVGLGFVVAFACAVVTVLTTKWHGKLTLDGTAGVQKFHTVPTPRVGGVAIMLGLIAACAAADAPLRTLFAPILLAGLPAFLFGVAEDLTKGVSVRTRLLATMASGMLAWAITGVSLSHTGIWGIDQLLAFAPLSVLFTAFAVGGVANAVNIIDGFNGLASGTVAICLAALGVISLNCGDVVLAKMCFAVLVVTLGFFFVNFPFGKLFLGDGGAYLLGFLLAWIAVMIPARNLSVSPWAPLLACAYPIFETLFTIARRLWTRSDPGQPDSHHLHSLVKVAIALRWFPNLRADLRNSSVSPFSWAIAALPACLAISFPDMPVTLGLSFVLSFAVYLCFYWYLASVKRSLALAVPAAAANEEMDADNLSMTA
ncbi:glycosyltransferase [Massilia sp. ZL223]|uniref:MraY family glycosyltransferase n=1 Tax=Massilia sp. ZL223 TaxID=2824904 RepID=UPI001E50537A|nr:glycosyltransferase [Massilia sp. ZL223]